MRIPQWAGVACAVVCAACASHPAVVPSPSPLGLHMSFVPGRGEAALAAFRPAVAAAETGGECSLTRSSGNGATTVSAGFPARHDPQLVVTMTFDSVGHLMRYSERRGSMSLPPAAGLTIAQRDSALQAAIARARLTSINLDWPIDQSMAMNWGGGSPTEGVVGTVKAMENLAQLGPVTARLERVRKLCGV